MRIKFLVLLSFFCTPLFLGAQESDLGAWYLLFGNKKFADKFNWHHEVQYRNFNIAGDLEQLLLRTGVGYDLADNANLLLGYGFIRSENFEDEVVNEHRIYQQLITKQKFNRFKLQHRYRFEQRFVEGDFRLRFRYFLGVNYSLWKESEGPKEWYLSIYDEVFLNTVQNVFDRNRLYGGVGYRINKSLRFEFGYMNQFLANGNRDQLNFVCFFSW